MFGPEDAPVSGGSMAESWRNFRASSTSPHFSPYNQTSDAFWDVDTCGATTYGSNKRTSDVNRV
jgi:hypothetical protein